MEGVLTGDLIPGGSKECTTMALTAFPPEMTKGCHKRARSSSPLKIKSEDMRRRMYGRKRGRPRIPTPGYDG